MRPAFRRFAAGIGYSTTSAFTLNLANKTVVGTLPQRNFGSVTVKSPHLIKPETHDVFNAFIDEGIATNLEDEDFYRMQKEFPLSASDADFFADEFTTHLYRNDKELYELIKKHKEKIERNEASLLYLQNPRAFTRMAAIADVTSSTPKAIPQHNKVEYLKGSFAAICFSQVIMKMLGFKTYNDPQIFIALSHYNEHQGIHIDGTANLDDAYGATALIPIVSDGITPTFFIDPREVAKNMSAKDLEILSKKEFYITPSQDANNGIGPFRIYDPMTQKFRISAGITHLNIYPIDRSEKKQEVLRNFLRVIDEKVEATKVILQNNETLFFSNEWLHQRGGEEYLSPMHLSLGLGIKAKDEEIAAIPNPKTERVMGVKIFTKENSKEL